MKVDRYLSFNIIHRFPSSTDSQCIWITRLEDFNNEYNTLTFFKMVEDFPLEFVSTIELIDCLPKSELKDKIETDCLSTLHLIFLQINDCFIQKCVLFLSVL